MAVTRRLRSTRWRLAMAAALLAISLGLPWGSTLVNRSMLHPGWYVGGLCRSVQTWDGWWEMACEPSFRGTPLITNTLESEDQIGASHPGRFAAVAGLALIALAWRRGRPRQLLLAAATLSVMTVLTSGLGFNAAGSSAAWLAAALLASGALQRSSRAQQDPG